MLNLKNKNIIITGASRGLGSEVAIAFSELGANLVLIARTKRDLETVIKRCKDKNRHLSISADLTDINKLKKSIDLAKKFLKTIDCVLHIAGGGLGKRDPLIKWQDLLLLFKLNVLSAAEINRLVLPDMIRKKQGNLVHIGSIAGREAVASVGYNTVKAALNMYVRSLGREVAGSGVIVTGINPGGFIATGNSMKRLENNNPEAFKNFIEQRLPRKRLGDTTEIIPLLKFLCSREASMMCGCMVPIDAGEGITP